MKIIFFFFFCKDGFQLHQSLSVSPNPDIFIKNSLYACHMRPLFVLPLSLVDWWLWQTALSAPLHMTR